MIISSYDIDGVIYINDDIPGLKPREQDIIITGRSFEEAPETYRMLRDREIYNAVLFNKLRFNAKTRITSGQFKGETLRELQRAGFTIACHYEDDEVQIQEIKKYVSIPIIHINHNLSEKENRRHS